MTDEKRIIFHAPCRTLEEFKPLADCAVRLKEHGRVIVVISCQHAVPRHEFPVGGSGWHEYALTSPGLHRFFPAKKLQAHMDMSYVQKNKSLIIAKASYLQELGLEAAWWGVEPHFLPHGFFEEFPHLRGPRCDHPRRSRREEFSICPDQAESQEIISEMVHDLRSHIPNLAAFIFKTNDAGAALCWANANYDGPNGPAACKGLSPGQHLANYTDAVHAGLKSGGGDCPVIIGHANFWANEIYDHQHKLSGETVLSGQLDKQTMGFGACDNYPVRGMIDPSKLINLASQWHNPEKRYVFMGFRASYDRGNELPYTVNKVIDIFERVCKTEAKGQFERLALLRELCADWAGKDKDILFDALCSFHQNMTLKSAVASELRPLQVAASCRHLTRPLLFNPHVLNAEEESYFLPYIFNIHESEARDDYLDQHGGTVGGVAGKQFSSPQLNKILHALRGVAKCLEGLDDAPDSQWLQQLARSIRVYYHLLRSMNNFYFAQQVRNHHADLMDREQYIPEKTLSFNGEGMILRWKELQRDEYDNIAELIKLFEEHGLNEFSCAVDPEDQDSMSFPPHIVDDLKKKLQIMRKYWLEVEQYLAPPFK